MFSKKHFILQKARSEFEKRIEQGEDIKFNFVSKENAKSEEEEHVESVDCGAVCQQQKRRKLSKYTDGEITTEMVGNSSKMTIVQTEEEPELISYDEFFQHYKTHHGIETKLKPTVASPSVSPTRELTVVPEQPLPIATSTRKRGGKKNAAANTATNNSQGGAQAECCLIGCHNTVTNRLRFSLRCHKNEDFKNEFLENGWNKVCHYHYFSDLYKYKKMTHGIAKNGANATTTPTKKAKSPSPVPEVAPTTLGKRSRKTFEESQSQPASEVPAVVDQRLEDANVFVHFLMTTKQGGDL